MSLTTFPFFAPHYTCLSALHVPLTTSHYCVPWSPIVQMQLACHQPEHYTVVSFNLKLIIQVFCMPKVCIILSIFTLYALLYCNSLQNDLSQLTC